MTEIICPKCKTAFKVDESGYLDILKQVHDREFDNKLNERLHQVEKDHIAALKLAEKDSESAVQSIATKKDIEIERLNSKIREKESTLQSSINPVFWQYH